MIRCIFTFDYEIYGDGTGSLQELVYEPTVHLRQVFEKWDARFVNFVEVAEFEQIEAAHADPAVYLVRQQVKDLHRSGHEIALHLHPQWYNARFEGGRWELDYTEYNLCTLPKSRIAGIVDRSLNYLSQMVDSPQFRPLSFRAGNWLFQPTENVANELSRWGVRIDSSVFKGGLQHNHHLDYRPAMKNGYYWSFSGNVNEPDPAGAWLELPIYTEMVAPWKMSTPKRIGMGHRSRWERSDFLKRARRASDFLRFRYPLKFDFCRMTLHELTSMMSRIIAQDQRDPGSLKPIVAIGHSKDLKDVQAVDAFLSFLQERNLPIVTFESVFNEISSAIHAS